MLMPLADLVAEREKNGLNWPSRKLLYQWIFHDLKGFKSACLSKFGKKWLIDRERFDLWLKQASTEGTPHVYKTKTCKKEIKKTLVGETPFI